MKNLTIALCILPALLLSAQASAREMTFTINLKDYAGDGAYLVLYLTNAQGRYQQTLWVSGQKSKYYKHLSGWARGSRLNSIEYDGMTGATTASGSTLVVTLDVSDAYIDTDYQLRVDTAIEDLRDNRDDIVSPLSTDGAGKIRSGRGYVNTFSYSF